MSNTVLYSYSLNQAVADGVLVPVFRNRWDQLSGSKPIVATAAIFEELSLAAILEIWNAYVTWRTTVMPTLPEEERRFTAAMNGEAVWVLEDEQAFTVLYADQY